MELISYALMNVQCVTYLTPGTENLALNNISLISKLSNKFKKWVQNAANADIHYYKTLRTNVILKKITGQILGFQMPKFFLKFYAIAVAHQKPWLHGAHKGS